MSEPIVENSAVEETDVDQFFGPITSILESNGIGEKGSFTLTQVALCAKDASGNMLLRADVGVRRFFMTMTPAMKGRLVGEDKIEDDEVRMHFNTNIIGNPLK